MRDNGTHARSRRGAIFAVVIGLATLVGALQPALPAGAASPGRATDDAVATTPYRDARAGYAIDYPTGFEPTRDGDTTVFRGHRVTLKTFGVARDGVRLRPLAAAQIDAPARASEVQNSRGAVVLVQADGGAARTVKAIALADGRAAVLVIDGRLNDALRNRVLGSFRPLGRPAPSRRETDADTRFHSAALGFSIERPRAAQVDREAAGHIGFTVLGPGNAAASEMTDGFSLDVVRQPTDAPTLSAYAREVGAGDAPRADRIRVAGRPALRYRRVSELGTPVTHVLMRPVAGTGYHITYSVVGEQRARYRRQIDTMLDSLRFDVAGRVDAG